MSDFDEMLAEYEKQEKTNDSFEQMLKQYKAQERKYNCKGAQHLKAKTMLENMLKGGAKTVQSIKDEAKKLGISWSTIERAKEVMDIESIPTKKSSRFIGWQWELKSPCSR